MSDKPSILEGGSSRNFSPVDSLSINKQSDGLSTWISADSIEMGSLDASKNGLYLAFEDDYFAYDQIVVNVSDDLSDADDATKATGKIVGKDPDIDPNNDYAVGLDEDGNLTKEMIPAAIHIVVPPRKLKYEEGETLDFTGIHVYLMDGNNKRYTDSSYPTGEIPFGELIFPVSIAESSGSSGELNHLPSEIEAVATPPYSLFSTSVIRVFERFDWVGVFATNVPVTACAFVKQNESNYVITVVVASPSAFMYGTTAYKADMEETIPTPDQYVDSPYTVNNKTVYHTTYGVDIDIENPNNEIPYVMCEDANLISRKNDIIAWNMLYGDVTSGGGDSVPVQWMRSDGETLEDTFGIEVGEGGEPSPEPEPDPWGGYADVSWGGHHYNLNRRLVPPVQYSNGYCWRQQASEYIAEYTVEQAASMGWLILIR